MKNIAFLILFLLIAPFKSFALDQDIRVLSVYSTNASDPSFIPKIVDSLGVLADTWSNSNLTVPIILLNKTNPLALNTSLSGSASQQHQQAEVLQGLKDLRNDHGADLVVVYTSGITDACGVAPTEFWIDPIIPTSFMTPIDLRGAEVGYIAVVDIGCPEDVTAHELGHLFGAGHVTAPGGSHPYLFDDSHADAQFFNIPPPINILVNYRTIVSDTEAECANQIFPCMLQKRFSTRPGYNNFNTLQKTAFSVANYRQTPVILASPTNLWGYLVGSCSPPPLDHHKIFWSEGGSNVAIDHYQIFYSQPPTGNYIYGWSRSFESTDAYVAGLDASVKVRACTTTLCSNLSAGSYLATWGCD